MAKKANVQNYYLKFTDYVEVIYAAYKEPEKDWIPCTDEQAQQIVKLNAQAYMIYKQAYEANRKQNRKTRTKA